MSSKTLFASLALLGSTLAATPASAHAYLAAGQATAGSTYVAVMRIPHGCEGRPTLALTIDIPEGVINAKPMLKAGWTVETVRGAYAKTYEYHGRQMSEGVRQIRWSGGELPDDFFDEFVFMARVTGDLAGTTVAFPTTQFCADEAQVAWTEIAAPGQDPHDLAHPAPALTVVAAAQKDGHGHGHGHAQPQGQGDMQMTMAGDLIVEEPFARATPGPAKNGAAFLTITNAGAEADRLIAARAAVADRVELHTHLHENGVMKMRQIEAVEVPAGGVASLEPGGDHIMMMGLTAPLKEGESFPLTLVFEKAGEVTVEVTIGGVGAMQGQDHGGHGKHGGHDMKKSN